ncbi:hypothetical protein J4464_02195 [Candidatus Woesearchaeota archaeon]|nr:hypothetical protein [Candidatus Woesearchaeota archaeon]
MSLILQSKKQKIMALLEEFKEQGKQKFDLIDLQLATDYSLPDLNIILQKLEREGRVKQDG